MPAVCEIPSDFDRRKVSLNGKSILISDAATDIGHSLSLSLAEQGATLLLVARKGRNLNALYDLILDQGGAEPLIIEMDLTQALEDQYAILLSGLEKTFSALHGLVHLSLCGAPLAPISLTTTNTWQQCHDLALVKPMILTRTLLPLLQQAGSASVVFNTLAAGREGRAYWGALGAACAGIENMSQTLAQEVDNVRFNTLDIGKVGTDLRYKFYPAEANSTLRKVNDKLVHDYFLYLLTEESKNIKGKQFRIPDL